MTNEIEQNRRMLQGQEAKRILQSPLIKDFFTTQLAMCHKAFCALPMGCKIEQYQTVQHDFLALKRLESSLERFITVAEADIFNRQIKDNILDEIDV